jgi:hypothetical protein
MYGNEVNKGKEISDMQELSFTKHYNMRVKLLQFDLECDSYPHHKDESHNLQEEVFGGMAASASNLNQ